MSSNFFERFDARSTAVLISTTRAIGLPIFAFVAPSFIVPGGMKYLILIWLFSALTFGITLYTGRLSDRQFAFLGFGGMLGVAWAAYLVTDPAASRAIVALLAAIPAIAAMASSLRVTATFTAVAVALAVLLSTLNATSTVAILVAGGAAVTTVLVPVFMVGRCGDRCNSRSPGSSDSVIRIRSPGYSIDADSSIASADCSRALPHPRNRSAS